MRPPTINKETQKQRTSEILHTLNEIEIKATLIFDEESGSFVSYCYGHPSLNMQQLKILETIGLKEVSTISTQTSPFLILIFK